MLTYPVTSGRDLVPLNSLLKMKRMSGLVVSISRKNMARGDAVSLFLHLLSAEFPTILKFLTANRDEAGWGRLNCMNPRSLFKGAPQDRRATKETLDPRSW